MLLAYSPKQAHAVTRQELLSVPAVCQYWQDSVVLQVPLPALPEGLQRDLLEDIEQRMELSSAALPSAIFYTFINTHQTLNCVSFSDDGSLLAGGGPFLKLVIVVAAAVFHPKGICMRAFCKCIAILHEHTCLHCDQAKCSLVVDVP